MTDRNRELVSDSWSCNPKLFTLSAAFCYAFPALVVLPVPVWFDSVTVVMEICIVAARLQLFDYHNCGAVNCGTSVFGVQSPANENRRCEWKYGREHLEFNRQPMKIGVESGN